MVLHLRGGMPQHRQVALADFFVFAQTSVFSVFSSLFSETAVSLVSWAVVTGHASRVTHQ